MGGLPSRQREIVKEAIKFKNDQIADWLLRLTKNHCTWVLYAMPSVPVT